MSLGSQNLLLVLIIIIIIIIMIIIIIIIIIIICFTVITMFKHRSFTFLRIGTGSTDWSIQISGFKFQILNPASPIHIRILSCLFRDKVV